MKQRKLNMIRRIEYLAPFLLLAVLLSTCTFALAHDLASGIWTKKIESCATVDEQFSQIDHLIHSTTLSDKEKVQSVHDLLTLYWACRYQDN